MTAKRDSKSKDKRPKIKKETLKDLAAKEAENVKAGGYNAGYTRKTGC